jgi:hypothetical protein
MRKPVFPPIFPSRVRICSLFTLAVPVLYTTGKPPVQGPRFCPHFDFMTYFSAWKAN